MDPNCIELIIESQNSMKVRQTLWREEDANAFRVLLSNSEVYFRILSQQTVEAQASEVSLFYTFQDYSRLNSDLDSFPVTYDSSFACKDLI